MLVNKNTGLKDHGVRVNFGFMFINYEVTIRLWRTQRLNRFTPDFVTSSLCGNIKIAIYSCPDRAGFWLIPD